MLTVSLDGAERLETYTVYDALGRVRWALSPEASARLGEGVSADILEQYVYRYDYGSLSEWEWQHGASTAMQYGFSYDGLNRFTGRCKNRRAVQRGRSFPVIMWKRG